MASQGRRRPHVQLRHPEQRRPRPPFLAGRLNGDRVNALGVAIYGRCTIDELLALVKEHIQPRGLAAGFGGRIALTDGLIHHQDIRRALGLPREVPAERLRCALQFAPTAPPVHARKRIRGLSATAAPSAAPRSRVPLINAVV